MMGLDYFEGTGAGFRIHILSVHGLPLHEILLCHWYPSPLSMLQVLCSELLSHVMGKRPLYP